ncbi:MAG TPA: DUF3347 domain-containing protein [Puia sp.]|nr:DUF3347 domain-containing protein [Puia sp.]
MKKLVLLVIILVLAVFVGYKLFSHKDQPVAEKKDQPLSIGKNSGPFNSAFADLMGDYYSVKDALVEWDSAKADLQAKALSQKVDSLPFKDMKADSSVVETAKVLAGSVSNEAKGFIGEASLEQKRRAFNMLTDELYNLVRAVRYDGQIIYHVKCPMAFNDSEEAYWLSNSPKILNPYLGTKHPKYKQKMLGCGEINDSLDFSKK